jgi:hypothetical protein
VTMSVQPDLALSPLMEMYPWMYPFRIQLSTDKNCCLRRRLGWTCPMRTTRMTN